MGLAAGSVGGLSRGGRGYPKVGATLEVGDTLGRGYPGGGGYPGGRFGLHCASYPRGGLLPCMCGVRATLEVGC